MQKNWMRKCIAAMLGSSLLLTACLPAAQAAEAGGTDMQAVKLQTEYMDNPLGLDTPAPRFSWNLTSEARGQKQTAYQILVSTDQGQAAAGNGDVWDSGKVETDASNNIPYGGPALSSKTRYYWTVRVWDKDGQAAALPAPAYFETAMLSADDWSAQWITIKDETAALYPFITIEFPAVEARYVRLDCTKLGIPLQGDGYRVQLAEMMVYDADTGENVALNAAVTSNATYSNGWWEPEFLVDGQESSGGIAQGYTSDGFASPDSQVTVDLDLGKVRRIHQVRIYGRNDVKSTEDPKIANFPRDFTIQTAGEDGAYAVQHTATDLPAPEFSDYDTSMPIFAKDFTLQDKEIASARAYVSGLGLFQMTVNGQKVTDALFEPGETNYDKRAYYVTYDITDKLTAGENAVGVALGKGFYYNLATPDRYNRSPRTWGPLMLLAQIEVTYADGETQVIGSDTSWKYAKGPYVECSWLGGEDYDARREKTGFDMPGYDYTGWEDALPQEYLPFQTLSAKAYPSIRVVEELPAVSVTNPQPGRYVVDFGKNFAGIYSFTASLPAGTRVEFHPAEQLLENGMIDPASTGSSQQTPIYDSYTFKGAESETYSPTFVYHGFRYLEIRGLSEAPSPEQFTGLVARADNEQVGEFDTSSEILDQVHTLITRSISDNMYSMLTDCPHREKLGWMEVAQLLFNSVADNFDVAAWSQHVSQNVLDAQKDYGSYPAVVPPLTAGHAAHLLRPGPDDTPNDPTWAGAGVLYPWYAYLTYGNIQQLRESYDSMKRYMDYLGTLVEKNQPYILESEDVNRNLGDWYSFEPTSVTFVISCTYYQLCDTMGQIAALLDRPADEADYTALTAAVGEAINAAFYNAETGNYDTGSQTANGLPLFLGFVPEGEEQRVLENLVQTVVENDYHLSSGEVGLRPVLNVLSENGYADVAYRMITNETMPSYYYLASIGKTSLTESWEGRDSQNHCMLGHGEGWLFEYLGGIRNAGVGYDESIIAPLIPDDLTYADVSTGTRYGDIRCSWKREGNTLTADIWVPVNTTSTIQLPAVALDTVTESGRPLDEAEGVVDYSFADKTVTIQVGSGHYTFVTERPETLYPERLQYLIDAGRKIQKENVIQHYTALQNALPLAEKVLTEAQRQAELDAAADDLEAVLSQMKFKGNLALHKPAEVSSSMEDANWSSQKLTDGDQQNGGAGYTSSADEYNQHTEQVTIDLLSVCRITRVDVYPRYWNGAIYTFPEDFTLSVSADGETWTEVVKEEGYPLIEQYAVQSFTFPAVEARYVRLDAQKLRLNPDDGNRYRLQIAEMEVYDDTPQTLEEAKASAEANLGDLTYDNDTTADAVWDAVASALVGEGMEMAWEEPFQKEEATDYAEGRIQGSITLQLDGQSVSVVIDEVIPQLEPPAEILEKAREAAQEAVDGFSATNATTAEEILAAVEAAVDNEDIAAAWTEDFQKQEAAAGQAGSITGVITLTYKGLTAQVTLSLVIPALEEVVKGDMDGDGDVDITDVMAACRVLARKNAGSLPTDDEMLRGDMNGDNQFLIDDIMSICRVLARKK